MACVGLCLLLFSISMEARLEQRAAIKMCVRAGESVKETVRKLGAAWGADTISVTQIRFWFKRFQGNPQRNTKDEKHLGRPVSKRTAEHRQAVEDQLQQDRCTTVQQLATSCNIGKSTAHTIVKKDLNLTKLAPKYVPRVLTVTQHQTRLKLCRDNVALLEQDPGILSRLIATDESWVFTYDPRTKCADMEWTQPDQPCPRKARRSQSQWKMMLIFYFDSYGPFLSFL